MFALLVRVIGLGIAEAIGRNTLGGGYDDRATGRLVPKHNLPPPGAPKSWSASQSSTSFTQSPPRCSFLVWPFTRLVHAWSFPVQYIERLYILYRRLWSPIQTAITTDGECRARVAPKSLTKPDTEIASVRSSHLQSAEQGNCYQHARQRAGNGASVPPRSPWLITRRSPRRHFDAPALTNSRHVRTPRTYTIRA